MTESVPSMNINPIFYDLLQHGQLSSVSEDYRKLMNNPRALEDLERMARDFDCQIVFARDVLYLVPHADNNFLGYSRSELKKLLVGYGTGSSARYYLMMFILLVLFHEFYGTDYGAGRRRSFIKLGVLMNKVDEALRQGMANEENNEEMEAEIPFSAMLSAYNSLKPDLEGKKDKGTKKALYIKLFKMMEQQNLLYWIESSEEIRPRQRLDDLFDLLLRSDEGYDAVMRMTERITNA